MGISEEHKYLHPERDIYEYMDNWFISVGMALTNAFRYEFAGHVDMPDLRTHRQLLAYELAIASHPSYFWQEYSGDTPKPTENDRLDMISHIKFIASLHGLLHVQEIDQIINGPFESFLQFIYSSETELPTRFELKEKILKWKKDGYIIVGFQGSFDPPTETHLLNATDAILLAQEKGVKFKIIFILDGDELIQRKSSGDDLRPRFTEDDRRAALEPFWQVAGTCISNVTSEKDWRRYALEYHELGLDYILITSTEHPTFEDNLKLIERISVVRMAKMKVLWLEDFPLGISSTAIMKRFI